MPPDHVSVDIRPGSPGGEYPLKGSILLRSYNSIISFVALGIAEDAGYHVDPDSRTGPVQRNPAHVPEIEESSSPLRDAEFDVEFEGKYYSIRKFPISEGVIPGWNQEAFRFWPICLNDRHRREQREDFDHFNSERIVMLRRAVHEDLPGCPARKSGGEWQPVA